MPVSERSWESSMIETRSAAATPETAKRGFVFRTSFAQWRLWFLHQFDPLSPVYNITAPLRLSNPCDVPTLRRTLDEIVRRHEALRTTFSTVRGEPVQVVAPSQPLDLEEVDLRHLPAGEREAEAGRWAMRDARRPFSLVHGPLFRATLLVLGASDYVLLLTLHHIVSDGWSMTVLVNEIVALYNAFAGGRPSPLPELPIQYPDFAEWQREWLAGPQLDEQVRYWKARLAGAPEIVTIPPDRPRPGVQSYRGGLYTCALDPVAYRALCGLAEEAGATRFMSLLAVFQTLVYRYCGELDVVTGTPVANRSRPEVEQLIGCFVNTLVIRTSLAGEPTFRDVLASVRDASLGAYAHQDVPFERLVEELRPSGHLSHNPLFQIMFVFHKAAPAEARTAEDRAAALPAGSGTAKFDVTLYVGESGGEAECAFEYNSDLFDHDTIVRLAGRFSLLLDGVVRQSDLPVSALPILGADERHRLLHEWNATEVAWSTTLCVQERIVEQARATPNAIAVIHGGESLTYRDLVARANRVAAYLVSRGVAANSLVGVYMERSLEMVAGLVGILQAGAAYLPIDPEYPRDRVAFMLEDAAPVVLLTQGRLEASLPAHGAVVVRIDDDWPEIAAGDPADPSCPIAPHQWAYMIYTSGSTGRPKGAINAHAGIANRLLWMQAAYGLDASDRVLQKTPISFDVSVWELFWPLMTGATMIVADPGGHRNVDYLIQVINDYQVTTAHFVPSMLRLFLDHPEVASCTSLRRVIASGEALPADLERRFARRLTARLHNLYGPTEAAVDVTAWACPPDGSGSNVPIGRPIANTQIHLLDAAFEPVPIGVAGELWIGGVGVGAGYWRRPELTAERFVPDPFRSAPGSRLYRTGDRARYRPDGNIEFLGRLDDQEKVRGLRIELGEIEATLRLQAAVKDAVVLAREFAGGDRRLVAYIVPDPEQLPALREQLRLRSQGLLEESDLPSLQQREHELHVALRRQLAASLPDYMLPSSTLLLEELPRLPNGKLDRKALPPASAEAGLSRPPDEAPRTPVEQQLAHLFCDILGRDGIGVHDDFFEVGGHSLLAAQALSRIREAFGVPMTLREFFKAASIDSLAKRIGESDARPDAPPLERVAARAREGTLEPVSAQEISRRAPLSSAQTRLWLFDRFQPGSSAYNVPLTVLWPGSMDPEALEGALNEIVRRHEILRTTFGLHDGQPVQIIAPSSTLRLTRVDLSAQPVEIQQSEVNRIALEESRFSFDLSRGPLIRATLIRRHESDHVLVLLMHHIISDGWSIGVLLREISLLYGACLSGQLPLLPPLPIQYADYAVWQARWLRGPQREQQLAYWRAQLNGIPPYVDLPLDTPRRAHQGYRGDLHRFSLDRGTCEKLMELAKPERVTLYMTLFAALNVLLYRYTRQSDLVVGSPIANRTRPELEGLIGLFANLLVVRTRVSAGSSFRQLMVSVWEVMLGAYEHQEVPFEELLAELRPGRELGTNSLVQVAFSFHTQVLDDPGDAQDADHGSVPQVGNGTAKFELTFFLAGSGSGIDCFLEYDTDLFDAATTAGMIGRFKTLLLAITGEPDRRITELPILTPEEQRQIVSEWSGPDSESFAQPLVVSVAAHAWSTPHAPAIVSDDATLSYGELERAASRLAARLVASGAGSSGRVGVCLRAAEQQIVAVLAVLKSGAVVVPLDPAEPPARMELILEDAGLALLLTEGGLRHRFGGTAQPAQIWCLDHEGGDREAVNAEPPAAEGASGDLAWVSYVSDAGGSPRSVPVSPLALGTGSFAGLAMTAADRVAHLTGPGQEMTWFEMLRTLGAGACGVAIQRQPPLSPRKLGAALRAQAISILYAPAATVDQLAREFPRSLVGIRAFVCYDDLTVLRRLRRTLDADVARRVYGLYGATEAGGACLLHRLDGLGDDEVVSVLGQVASGRHLHLLDRNLNPVPEGIVAELYVGGPGSTRTAGMAATGRLARQRRDGTLELRPSPGGRVSVDGVRIELQEVEAVLMRHPGVADAAVVAAPGRGLESGKLAAFVVALAGASFPPEELSAFVDERLPELMRPRTFTFVASLPRTGEGEVSRPALEASATESAAREPSSPYAAPETPIEETIAGLWARAFGLERVGRHDDFYRLGGQSLLATQIVAHLGDAFQIEFPLRRLFEAPTVAQLAAIVSELVDLEAGGAASRQGGARQVDRLTTAAPVGRSIPLSFSQRRLWFLDQFEPMSPFYNVPAAVRLPGVWDARAFGRALDLLVRRQASLRTTFGSVDGEPVQIVAPSLSVELEVNDLRGVAEDLRWSRAQELAALEARTRFDLQQGPLIRAKLLQLGEADHLFLVTVHHIICDGWSVSVLFRDLAALYAAELTGRPAALPELRIQYADYAEHQSRWLQGEVLERRLGYWRPQLAALPELLELPTDHPRPAVQVFRGGACTFAFPAALSERTKALAADDRTTLFMVLLAVFKLLLFRHSGQTDLVVGTPIANRSRPELEPLIGFFVNTLVLRTRVSPESTFRQLLASVREATLDAYTHQDMPFEKLVEELQPQRSLAYNPLFQVMFALQNMGAVAPGGEQPAVASGIAAGNGTSKFDLSGFMLETTGGIQGAFEYNADLFDLATSQRMARHFEVLLAAAVADPGQRLPALPLLTAAEIAQLAEWNAVGTAAEPPAAHRRVESQAAQTPSAPAILDQDGRALSYGELNARANALAAALRKRGVGADTCVGLCMQRSADLLVAVLAVLKAGGAYLPLDPGYPAERLAFMVEDSRAPLILTRGTVLDWLPETDPRVLALALDDLPAAEGGDPESATTLEHLAYVIYTSGSTGRAKGVAMPHRPLANLLEWQIQRSAHPLGARTLQYTSLSFDVSFQEIFSTLGTGGTLVLVSEEDRRDPGALWDLLEARSVNRLFVPYVALQALAGKAAERPRLPASLREVITAGEQLHITRQVAQLFERMECALYNQYGPSETHVVTEFRLSGPVSRWPQHPPIGRPIANTSLHVLDGARQPVPIGVFGEIYIGGVALAREYLHWPEMTRQRFVTGEDGRRLYRTGDRARYLPDGNLEFHGRFDDQVKIRGFRVELGEVELALRRHPEVREAAVIARRDADELRLIAYLQPRTETAVPAAELRAYLAKSLPDYMLPAAFATVEAFPLTPSGKLDRRSLAALAGRPFPAGGDYAAPRTPIEEQLAGIWCELLCRERVGIRDNFFELGGHSLLATRVISRVRDEWHVDVPLRRCFEAPTIEAFAPIVLQLSMEEESSDELEQLLAMLEEAS